MQTVLSLDSLRRKMAKNDNVHEARKVRSCDVTPIFF